MNISISQSDLKEYLGKQLDTFFPDGYHMSGKDIDTAFSLGLERLEKCFKCITFPAYSDENGNTFFSHLHADQYAQFLYFFSNSLWDISQNKAICDKVLNLNRLLNGFFLSYKCNMPDYFFLGHPVGSIIGNAVYSDYLVVFQNVTINTDQKEDGSPAPEIGKGVFLGAGAKIIGNKRIGDRVSISVDAMVYDMEIPDDSVVIRDESGKILVKDRKKKTCMAQNYFRNKI
ncbi:MAG: hypothetical protein K6E10_08120 [Eubacterium sp.]|nr:hypothetical protein [Eubacterium sp.]